MPLYEFEIGGRRYEVDAAQMPSGAQMRSIASKMGGAPATRTPARPEDFMDPQPAAPEGSALGRLTSKAWDMLNPVSAVSGLASAVAHPYETGKALIGAQVEQGRKALDAAREGRYSEAVGHGGAALLPVFGPVAANTGEYIAETGDIAGGVGQGLGLILPVAGGRAAVAKAQSVGAKTGAVVKAALDPGGATADAVRWALKNGVPVDAATATGNAAVKGARALADRTIGGSMVAKSAAEKRAASMAKLGRKLANDAAPGGQVTAETAGEGVRGSVESVIRQHADTADAAYQRVRDAELNAMPEDVAVARKVDAGRTVDQGFIGHWLADDLKEMGYEAGGVTKGMSRDAYENWRPGDMEGARYGIGAGAGRTRGTPTQEMFHAAGVSGSRAEIATKVRRYLTGETNNPRIGALIDAMGEAWDGQRFDFQLLRDETLARTGLKRSQFKSPVTMPAMEAPGAAKFFGEGADSLAASNTEPMQFAVPLANAKAALRPAYERLMRKKELTGQLMGDEGRAAVALDAILSGGDHAPLSVVDGALGDLKAAARGAAMPELRTGGQGVAALAVKELENTLQAKAKAVGVWDDLRAGRDATIQKWSAADTLKMLKDEPVGTFRALTQNGDAAIEKLRDVKKIAPGELPRVGRAYLEGLIDTATNEGGFGHEAKLWADWQRMGDETKRMLYPDPALRESLDKFFLVGKKMAENPNPSGSGYIAALSAQGTALLFEPVSGAATVLAGGVLSKALNSPKVTRLLTEAMQTPKTAPAAKSLTVRLRALLKNYGPATAMALGASQTQRAQATP